jgi:hypothetical protein
MSTTNVSNTQNSEDIVNAIQSLQNLEKQLHNQLNQSLIQNSISTVSENIYVGNSSEKTKNVDLPTNISFTSVDGTGFISSGTSMMPSGNSYTTNIIKNNGSQQLQVTGGDQGWSEQLYLKGTGYLASQDEINNQSMTKTNQADLIEKINKVSNARVAMFKSLNQMYDNSVRSSVNSRNDLVHQITALKMVEDELSNAKGYIDTLKIERDNKLRMAELNMYESERYDAYVKFLKLILFVALPVTGIFFLLRIKFFSAPESNSGFRLIIKDLLMIVMAGILVYGTYRIILNAYDLSIRNNMNFNSYDFDFQHGGGLSLVQYDELQDQKIDAALKADVSGIQRGIKTVGTALENAGCIGQECCGPHTTYNKKTDKCIPNTSSESTSQTPSLKSITTAAECTAAGGKDFNYCPETGKYYCCGVDASKGYEVCGGTDGACPSNSGLQNCVCPSDNTYTPIGAFKDFVNGVRAMKKTISTAQNYSAEKCSTACDGYKYFGLQDPGTGGSQCFCSNSLHDTTQFGPYTSKSPKCGYNGAPGCNYVYENK